MSKTTNKFFPEVRERAVRLVLDSSADRAVGSSGSPNGQHGSRWHHSDRGNQYLSIKDDPRGWPKRVSNLRSLQGLTRPHRGHGPLSPSATAMTRRWPRRSTGFSKPRSSIVAVHGAASRRWNTQRWNGSTGSTIAACSSRSGPFRPPRQKQTSMLLWKLKPWPRHQPKSASGKPGAVPGSARCEGDGSFLPNERSGAAPRSRWRGRSCRAGSPSPRLRPPQAH